MGSGFGVRVTRRIQVSSAKVARSVKMGWEVCSINYVQDGAEDTNLGYRSLNLKASRVFSALMNPKEAAPKIGL